MEISGDVYNSLKHFNNYASNINTCIVWLIGFYTPASPTPVVVSSIRGLSAPHPDSSSSSSSSPSPSPPSPSLALDLSQDLPHIFSVVPGGLQVVGLFLFAEKSIGGEAKALESIVKQHKEHLCNLFSFGTTTTTTTDGDRERHVILSTSKKSLQMAELDEIFFYSTKYGRIVEGEEASGSSTLTTTTTAPTTTTLPLTRIPQEGIQTLSTTELATQQNHLFLLTRVSMKLHLSVVFPDGEYKQRLLETATPLLDALRTGQLFISVKSNNDNNNTLIGGEPQRRESVLESLAPLRTAPSKGANVEWLDGTVLLSASPSQKAPAKVFIDQSKGNYRHVHTTSTVSILYYLSASVDHEFFLKRAADLLLFQASKVVNFMSSGPNISPTIFHFMPPKFPHPITLLYPTDKTISQENDDYLSPIRTAWHRQLMLPIDRPVLRYYNQLDFTPSSPSLPTPAPNPLESDFRIKDLHIQLQLHEGTSTGGAKYLVQGSYLYYHYQQDMNDSGWGCAYRSLQTLCSWMVLQGFTAKPVPSHLEIQRILVDLGDKEKKFIGSNEWIGSQEVFLCLDHLYGVSAKILNVPSGADIVQKGEELSRHFKIEGTPVMIGGGVLAYTLLGVDYNASTGAIKFLYTGQETLKNIKDKWCTWKEGSLFKRDAHYNLCMPLRPKKV